MRRIHRLCAAVLIGCLISMFPGVTMGNETAGSDSALELTLDEAVERALIRSNTLKLTELDIERNEKIRDSAAERLQYTPMGPTDEPYSSAFTGLVASDLAWRMSQKTKDVKSDTLVMSVFQNYTGVLTAQEKVAAAEKALSYANWQCFVARIGYDVGTVSLSAKTMAEAGYTGKAAALESAKVGLDDSYQKLNSLIGFNSDDRPLLKEIPTFVPLKVDNLEAYIQIKLDNSPSIWLAEKNVDLAKINLDLYNWSDPSRTPYRAKEIDVTKAQVTVSDTKEQMRQLIRNLYQNIRQMEEQYAAAEQTLKLAEETLRIKQVQFDVGMATKGDVLSAENDVISSRQILKTLVFQHEVLKLAFDKPWAYAGAASSLSASGSM